MNPNTPPSNEADPVAPTYPLFPLPNCVIFPSVITALHIFEHRYREMTADALASHRSFVLVLIQPGWEAEYEGAPPIHSIGCLARIVDDRKLPDGRYNLVVIGGPRVRILEEIPHSPYRKARIQALDSPQQAPDWTSPSAQRLSIYFDEVFCRTPQALSSIHLDPQDTPDHFCDKIVASLQMDAQQKQALLAELDIERRLETTGEILHRITPTRAGHYT